MAHITHSAADLRITIISFIAAAAVQVTIINYSISSVFTAKNRLREKVYVPSDGYYDTLCYLIEWCITAEELTTVKGTRGYLKKMLIIKEHMVLNNGRIVFSSNCLGNSLKKASGFKFVYITPTRLVQNEAKPAGCVCLGSNNTRRLFRRAFYLVIVTIHLENIHPRMLE